MPFFFNKIEVIGKSKIPKDGAVIFAPNHQGAFMDAVMVGTFTEKPVSFLTRADIFKKPALPFLYAFNMLPIYRIRDGVDSLGQNEGIFEKCYEILSKNEKRLLIFPEGNHSADFYLRPLMKGISRIAFGAREALDNHQKLFIVPTGINYFSHRYPAKVILHFGDPINVGDFMPAFDENNQKGYQNLKNVLEAEMKKVLILPEAGEDYELRKGFLFQQRHEHLSFDEMKELAKGAIGKTKRPTRNMAVKFLITFFTTINFPVYLSMRKILNMVKDQAFYISLKFYTGAVLIFFWWIILFTVGVLTIGAKFGVLLILASLLFFYARKALIGYSN